METPKDLDSNSGLKKSHSQVGSGFFQRLLGLEGWEAGCQSRGGQEEAAAMVQTLEEDPKPGQGPGAWGRRDQHLIDVGVAWVVEGRSQIFCPRPGPGSAFHP